MLDEGAAARSAFWMGVITCVRLAALTIILGWPLGPLFHSLVSKSPLDHSGRTGRVLRAVWSRRTRPVHVTWHDVCPICLEPLLAPGAPIQLQHCQWGCGRAVHARCWGAWARSAVCDELRCCVCRRPWE